MYFLIAYDNTKRDTMDTYTAKLCNEGRERFAAVRCRGMEVSAEHWASVRALEWVLSAEERVFL